MKLLDVFRIDNHNGSPVWLDSVGSLLEARELIRRSAYSASEQFLVFNESTYEKLTIRAAECLALKSADLQNPA